MEGNRLRHVCPSNHYVMSDNRTWSKDTFISWEIIHLHIKDKGKDAENDCKVMFMIFDSFNREREIHGF